MNWQKAAIEDLRKYDGQSQSLQNLRLRVAALKSSYEAIRCSLSDSTPVQGGASRIEDRMLNNIVEREKLKHNYRAAKYKVELVERGLAGLDDRQRLVLERMYIRPERGAVERLMEELGYEQRQVYNIKDRALYQFTICMYGLIDY